MGAAYTQLGFIDATPPPYASISDLAQGINDWLDTAPTAADCAWAIEQMKIRSAIGREFIADLKGGDFLPEPRRARDVTAALKKLGIG